MFSSKKDEWVTVLLKSPNEVILLVAAAQDCWKQMEETERSSIKKISATQFIN